MTWLNSPRKHGTAGQVGVKVQFHVGHVFPLVARHGDGAFDGFVEIGGGLFLAARMGKFLHGAHDLGDALDAFERFLDGGGDLLEEIIEVAGREQFLSTRASSSGVTALAFAAPSSSSWRCSTLAECCERSP